MAIRLDVSDWLVRRRDIMGTHEVCCYTSAREPVADEGDIGYTAAAGELAAIVACASVGGLRGL